MDDNDNFALVRKPSSAVEKTTSGAKLILSGMVADSLALTKRDFTRKPVFTVLLGADHFGPTTALMLAFRLGAKYDLRLVYFSQSSELETLTEEQAFDLIFLYVGNIKWNTGSGVGFVDRAADVLGRLNTLYGKPIVATQMMDLTAELERVGVIFLNMPFTVADFWARLGTQVRLPIEEHSQSSVFNVAILGISPGSELETAFISAPIQEILGNNFSVVTQCHTYAPQWEAALFYYDLLLIFLNPILLNASHGGEVDVQKLVGGLKSKSQAPIIILTNGAKYGLDTAPGFVEAGADGFFSFLPPFPTQTFKTTLKTCVAKSQAANQSAGKSAETVAQPQTARPLRIVSVDDEDWRLELVEMVVSRHFKGVTVQSFRDAEEAWQELLRTDPDLLITDDLMGKLDGDELVHRLADRNVSYPIIVINAYGPERDQWVSDCVKRGVDITMLRAPYDLESLLKALETGLKISRGTKEPVEIATQQRGKRPPRIVILDTDRATRENYKLVIREFFKEVTVLDYQKGEEAWRELQAEDPDLLITDLDGPGLNGWEMLRLLAEKKAEFFIVVISASSSEEKAVQCARWELHFGMHLKPYGSSTEQFRKILIAHFGSTSRFREQIQKGEA